MKIGKVCLGGFLVLAFLSVFAVGARTPNFLIYAYGREDGLNCQ